MPQTPDMGPRPGLLKTALLATLERTINQALATDPASRRDLGELAGHLVALEIRFPPFNAYLLVVEDGIELYHASDAEADVIIEGSALDLAAQFLDWRTSASPVGGPIRISGNQDILQKLSQIARNLRIDWGALFEPLLGSELAQSVEYGARTFADGLRQALGRVGQELGQRLQQDNGMLALRREVFEFNQDVDELRMDVDRLALRIQRIRQRQQGDA